MKTVINIKTDKETKKKAQELAEELGVTLTTIVNVYLKQFIRTKEFTFSLAYIMTPELEDILEEVEKDLAVGKNLSPRFSDTKSAMAWLEKEAEDGCSVS